MQRCSHGAGAVYDTSPRGVINAPTRTWLQHFPSRGSRACHAKVERRRVGYMIDLFRRRHACH